jgi:hypothetical protein
VFLWCSAGTPSCIRGSRSGLGAEEERLFDKSSEFYKNTGKVKVGYLGNANVGAAMPHRIVRYQIDRLIVRKHLLPGPAIRAVRRACARVGYCNPADLISYGLPRGALSNPGRMAASASASTNTIALDQHGFALNDQVTVRAEGGGSLPAPLVAGVTYYAIPVNESAFSVAATSGGAAIDFTAAGARIVVVAPVPVQAAIDFGAELINDVIPHLLPLVAPYPPIVVMTNAELAIGKLMTVTGSGSKSLGEMVDVARKRLERWSAGAQVRGANAQPSANLASTVAATTAAASDCRGWRRWGTL